VSLTGGNRNDVTQLLPLLDKVPTVAGVVGRPRRRPDALLADRGYDHDKYRHLVRERGITPVIAERGREHGSGLGVFRWVVERTIAWLHGFRRLPIRWERRDDIHEAFLGLATCLITHRHVQRLLLGRLRHRGRRDFARGREGQGFVERFVGLDAVVELAGQAIEEVAQGGGVAVAAFVDGSGLWLRVSRSRLKAAG
jgi:transposase